ncbi:uncharacterized protein PSFLO_02652 [Pseudozyma flocculosa]|uniref:Uncharacterized protein n=1 Tax=Pseudozyma flocculosa TaxID=84751 RepID=A0A5C3EZB7_9BASI|nr:uncharacterized protein PSFLO_02652 [Pseudozyma flocculosa]
MSHLAILRTIKGPTTARRMKQAHRPGQFRLGARHSGSPIPTVTTTQRCSTYIDVSQDPSGASRRNVASQQAWQADSSPGEAQVGGQPGCTTWIRHHHDRVMNRLLDGYSMAASMTFRATDNDGRSWALLRRIRGRHDGATTIVRGEGGGSPPVGSMHSRDPRPCLPACLPACVPGWILRPGAPMPCREAACACLGRAWDREPERQERSPKATRRRRGAKVIRTTSGRFGSELARSERRNERTGRTESRTSSKKLAIQQSPRGGPTLSMLMTPGGERGHSCGLENEAAYNPRHQRANQGGQACRAYLPALEDTKVVHGGGGNEDLDGITDIAPVQNWPPCSLSMLRSRQRQGISPAGSMSDVGRTDGRRRRLRRNPDPRAATCVVVVRYSAGRVPNSPPLYAPSSGHGSPSGSLPRISLALSPSCPQSHARDPLSAPSACSQVAAESRACYLEQARHLATWALGTPILCCIPSTPAPLGPLFGGFGECPAPSRLASLAPPASSFASCIPQRPPHLPAPFATYLSPVPLSPPPPPQREPDTAHTGKAKNMGAFH